MKASLGLGSAEEGSSEEVTIPINIWGEVIQSTPSWKAPGRDRIPIFWWKRLSVASMQMREICILVLQGHLDLPQWLVEGVTVLLPKKKGGCLKPSDYRPIACLNVQYKMFTSAVSRQLYGYLEEHRLLPWAQRAIHKGRDGCLDALMTDRMVIEDSRMYNGDLCMCWVDFRKGFDSISHQWLLSVMRHMHVPGYIVGVVERLMPLWRTSFLVKGGQSTQPVQYHRGVFQGDCPSPLLFCLTLVPLSYLLSQCDGYTPHESSVSISHLLYMDDLKVYSGSEKGLEQGVEAVFRFACATGITRSALGCTVRGER